MIRIFLAAFLAIILTAPAVAYPAKFSGDGIFSGHSGIFSGGGLFAGRVDETAFSPTDIDDLALWLDASDTSTISGTGIQVMPIATELTKRQLAGQSRANVSSRSTTDTVDNSTTLHRAPLNADYETVRLHYWAALDSGGPSGGETTSGLPASIQYKASVQVGSTIYAGGSTITLAPGEDGYIEVSGLTLTAGQAYLVHTRRVFPSGTKTVPLNTQMHRNYVFQTGSNTGTDTGVDITTSGAPYGVDIDATLTGDDITALTLNDGGAGHTKTAGTVWAYEVQANGVLAQKAIGTATISAGEVTGVTLTSGTPPTGVSAWVDPTAIVAYGGVIGSQADVERQGQGPNLITGIPSTEARSVVLVGSSLTAGTSTGAISNIYGDTGSFEFGIGNRVGTVNIGVPGGLLYRFSEGNYDATLARIMPYVTDAIIEHGVNEPSWSRTYAQVEADLKTLKTKLNTLSDTANSTHVVVNFATIPPRSNSSDSWATLGNQTEFLATGSYGPWSDYLDYVNSRIIDNTIPSDVAYIPFNALLSDPSNVAFWRASDGVKTHDGVHARDEVSATNRNGSSIASIDSTFQAAFDYLETVTYGTVSQWDDKSGNDNHATQGTGANQPLVGSVTVNGLNTLLFGGSNDFLQLTNGISHSNGYTVFFVVSPDNTAGNKDILAGVASGSGGAGALQLSFSSAEQLRVVRQAQAILLTGSASTTTPAIFSVTTSSAGSRIRINGASDGNNATNPAYTTSVKTIGANSNGESGWFSGPVAEILIYPRILTTAETNAIGGELSAKWGITWSNI